MSLRTDEGNITSGWGALSGEEETDRFFWVSRHDNIIAGIWVAFFSRWRRCRRWQGASLGVHVGHSETVLRHDVANDDDQPLWWAKGGTLVGTSPPRIKWFRELWEGNSSRPEFGSLSPTQSELGNAQDSTVVNILSDAKDFLSLHFLRPGRWEVPLPTVGSGTQGAGPRAGWEVRKVDYWAMTVEVIGTAEAGAAAVSIDVPEIPGNFEVVRAGASW